MKETFRNQVSLDDLQKNINRSFMICLSVNGLLDETRYSSFDAANNVLINDHLRQLNWVADQIQELEKFIIEIFNKNPDHIYRLKLQALFREIPRQIEQAQSSIISIRLNKLEDSDNVDRAKLDVHLFGLNDSLKNLYNSLRSLKI